MMRSDCSGCSERPNPLWLCLSPPLAATCSPMDHKIMAARKCSKCSIYVNNCCYKCQCTEMAFTFTRIFTQFDGLAMQFDFALLLCMAAWQASKSVFYKEKCLKFTWFSQRKLGPHFHFYRIDKLSFYPFCGGVSVSKHVYDARERDVEWEESKSLMTWFSLR